MCVSVRAKKRASGRERARDCMNVLQRVAVPRGCNQTRKLSINTLSNLFFSTVSHFHEPFVALVLQLSCLFTIIGCFFINKAFVTASNLHNWHYVLPLIRPAHVQRQILGAPFLENEAHLNVGDHTWWPLLVFGGNNGCIFIVRPQVLPASHMVTHGIGALAHTG